MMQGASVIAYPGFMEEAAKKMQGDFFILPSSVHEVLLLKDDGKTDYRDLEKIVAEVNRFAVEKDERLSDHVYHYDSRDRVFEMAEKYEDRKLARIEPKCSVLENLQEFGKNTVPRDPEKPKPQHGYEAAL